MNKFSGNIVDVIGENIFPGTIKIQNGHIEKIEQTDSEFSNYLIPGFIDSHVHIESSMMPPCEFARIAVQHGTIAAVCDPHEIANVMGLKGIQYMIEDSSQSPLK